MPLGSGNAKRERLFRDVYIWGLQHRDEPTNLMVISKNSLLDKNYVAALVPLKEKENNILLTLPQDPSELPQCVASFVWVWTSPYQLEGALLIAKAVVAHKLLLLLILLLLATELHYVLPKRRRNVLTNIHPKSTKSTSINGVSMRHS